MKKYFAIDNKKSKYYRNVPYITKKEFKKIGNSIITGMTRLKKYKSNSDSEVELLLFDNEQYEVKEKIFGFKKGYIDVGNNNYILLKSRIPFLFLIFLLLFLLLLCFLILQPKNNEQQEQYKEPTIDIIIDEEENEEDESTSDEKTENKFNNEKPNYNKKPNNVGEIKQEKNITYIVKFDANGGYGSMTSIKCNNQDECIIPSSKFKKEGYTFLGWSINSNGTAEIKSNKALSKTIDISENNIITLYAVWNINSYNITFLDYDDTVIQESKYNFGDKIIAPEEPCRKGYKFVSWDNDFKTAKNDLKVKALYEINNYNINYNLNGGIINDEPKNYNIEKEMTIPNPIKEGYTFTGWSINENADKFIKDYTIETGTIGDIELTANYEPNTYNLIFNTNGANEIVLPRKLKFGSSFGNLPVVTKKGYAFKRWENDLGEEVFNNTLLLEPNDVTINAKWETVKYSINYNLVGGKISSSPSEFTVESENITIPNPTKEGYTFIGWSINGNADKFVKDYTIETGTIGDIELTANYSPISYYISFDSQGAEGNMDSIKVKYNNRIKLTKNEFIKEGYNFIGWSLNENGDVVYKDESEIYNLTNSANKVIVLYAKWEVIKLKVQYIDLFGSILKEEIINYGDSSLPPEDPYIEGYTFTGWSSNNTVIKEDTKFIAKYSLNDYVIKYDLNIGKSGDTNTIHYNVNSENITLPTPSRIGYSFIGWTGTNNLIPVEKIIIKRGSVGNKEYKANWKANIYKISLNPNEGNIETDSILVPFNSVYGIIPNPIRSGYKFKGWYYDKNLIEETTVMSLASDHELTAKWETIIYNINYNLNGGSANNLKTEYDIESEIFTLPIPSKEGYSFIGWTGSNGNTPSKNVTIEKGNIGNLNYVANYTPISYSINYNLNGGSTNNLKTEYNIETNTFSLPIPIRSGYNFLGWTGSNGTFAQPNVSILKGTTGNLSYTANWEKYSSTNSGGIYMVSTRDNITWDFALDGFYKVGDTNVHSGNWLVTVSDYCVNITGTKYPYVPYTYQFYIYKANNTSELLATGSASVLGNGQNNARVTICW